MLALEWINHSITEYLKVSLYTYQRVCVSNIFPVVAASLARGSQTEKIVMALQAKLDSFPAELVSGGPPYNIPSFVIDTFRKGTAELIASGQASLAIKAGQQAPGFTLQDSEGATFSSDGLLSRGPLVVTFYRGVWCPYCNLELQALESVKPQFDKYGASLVAISPQTAPNSRKS